MCSCTGCSDASTAVPAPGVSNLLCATPLLNPQALRHPYFRELREAEKKLKSLNTPEPLQASLGASSVTGSSAMAGDLDKARGQVRARVAAKH